MWCSLFWRSCAANQTDAAINPGNSGGPLIDSSGNMIGISSAIFSPTGASVGIGFAIPVDTAKRVLQDLIERGEYLYPWAGLTLMTLTPGLAEALQLQVEKGALVLEVMPGSPAEKAGMSGGSRRIQVGNHILQVGGDVIVSMDGEPVTEADMVIRKIRKLRAGDRIHFEVLGSRGSLRKVTLWGKPEDYRKARQRIHHAPGGASFVELPLVTPR